MTALGGYAATAITALTAQNTMGVFAIEEVPDAFIARQIRLVLDDIGADAIKIGMLHKASVVETVADTLMSYPGIPVIIDPVMVAKGGAPLLQPDAMRALRERLIPMAAMITPNIPEAEKLLECIGRHAPIHTPENMESAAELILSLGPRSVLVKGGHRESDEVTDILVESAAAPGAFLVNRYTSPRIVTQHTHGTGCALASAIAMGAARKQPFAEAVKHAREYVREAILTAPGLGKGQGPLNHGWKYDE